MRSSAVLAAFLPVALAALLPQTSYGQLFPRRPSGSEAVGAAEVHIVDLATTTLDEVMVEPGKAIPQSLLKEAQGLAIVPSLVKGGFIVGVKHGRGVVLVRDAQKQWQAPRFITMSGGSVGWQAGLQQSDLILVFKSSRSVEALLRGRLTVGADAAAAAGPVGRQAAAATDVGLQAEIYSYSRSRGLFAGLALDGSVMQLDNNATQIYYSQPTATEGGAPGAAALPPSATKLLRQVNLYSSSPAGDIVPPAVPPPTGTTLPPTAGKQELAAHYRQMQGLLDEQWRTFLALPLAWVSDSSREPLPDLAPYLQRYERVAQDPSFQTLAEQPAFRQVLTDLRNLSQTAAPTRSTLPLPPPPR